MFLPPKAPKLDEVTLTTYSKVSKVVNLYFAI